MLVVLTLLVGGYFLANPPVGANSTGPQHLQRESFLQGLCAGVRDQACFSNTGGLVTTGASTVKIGDNGSSFAELKATTCNPVGMDGSQTASTTAMYDCAVTGIASGDVVLAQFATSTKMVGGTLGWWIVSAKASTTAGWVTLQVANGTGGNAVPSATNVASSTNIWYADI